MFTNIYLSFLSSKLGPGDLVVKSVNFLVDRNAKLHNTSKYELTKRTIQPKLVIRRAQPFQLKLNFERKFRYREDAISLVFVVKGRR